MDREHDADLIHRYCCNPETALCGEDLRGEDDCEVDDGQACVVCTDLVEIGDCDVTCPLVIFT